MNIRKEICSLLLCILGTVLSLLGLNAFNQTILMKLPMGIRMISMIVIHWGIMVVPVLLIFEGKEKFTAYGIHKDKLGTQIIVGVLVGVCLSFLLTAIPILLGLGDMVGEKTELHLWKVAFNFMYCIAGISLGEEFVFRGFVYEKIKRITKKTSCAVILSSLLFGLAHILSGNPIQVIMTAGLGVLFCVCRLKIRNCTLVSLVFAHGIYDALISLWVSVLV